MNFYGICFEEDICIKIVWHFIFSFRLSRRGADSETDLHSIMHLIILMMMVYDERKSSFRLTS